VAIATLATSILAAILAVIARRFTTAIPVGAATVAVALATMVVLQGHSYGTLPTTIYLGLIGAMAAVVSVVAIIAPGLQWKLP
jgi:uncharacterized membrane protein